MILASMVRLNEDALICDFAETYHIYDYRSLPIKTAAALAAGLRDDSRIKLCAADLPVSQNTILLASIADRLTMLLHMLTDSRKREEPVLILDKLLEKSSEQQKDDVVGFRSAEAFETAWKEIRGE